MDRPCSTNGKKRNKYRFLVGEAEGERPLGIPRRRWLDNIKMDLGEIEWGGVDCIGLSLARDQCRAFVNSVLYLRFAGKFLNRRTTGGLMRSFQLHGVS
jgi:hypothetical protein